MDNIVRLNIGGTTFTTTKQTLLSKGDNYFSSLLSGRIPTTIFPDGYFFIDRNGKYFEPILY
jgi:hypothetical protein